jgi:hypothetical protein
MLQEGQSVEVQVTLQPMGSKCYTGIAVASPPVEVMAELVATPPAPLPPTSLSQSTQSPVQTIMAGKPNCFKNLFPVPTPAVFRVTAKKGTGMVLGQLYEKLETSSNPRSPWPMGERGHSRSVVRRSVVSVGAARAPAHSGRAPLAR